MYMTVAVYVYPTYSSLRAGIRFPPQSNIEVNAPCFVIGATGSLGFPK